MKKLILSAASLLAFGAINAQVAKTPLIEHFTSASCPPCVTQNENMKSVLDAYTGNFVKVAHQGNYSYDPMEDQFPSGPSVRWGYYGFRGVPGSALNGTDGYPSDIVTATTLSAIAAETTPYEITVTQDWISATSVDLTVVVANTTGSAISSANKIFISMVEESVYFPSAPGSNGETEFRWVLRQMYNATSGAENATSGAALGTIAANDNLTFTFNVTPPSYVADLNEVSFAAYIQSGTGNDMEQAGKSSPGGVPGLLNLATSSNSTADDGYCDYGFDPIISFTNNSPDIIVTDIIVEYDINGGTPVQKTYTGNLTQGQATDIAFPNTNLASGSSEINYSVVSVNGANSYSASSVAIASETYNKINTAASATPITVVFDDLAFATPAPARAIADNPNDIRAYSIDNNVNSDVTWNLGGNGNSNGCFRWDYYSIAANESSRIVFEKLDFSGTTENQLKFTHAHALYNGNEQDQLRVLVSTDCGTTWTTVWDKKGTQLATVTPVATNVRFYPEASDWNNNRVDLSDFDNSPDVMIAFEGISGDGNSLYIDDINTNISTGVNTVNNTNSNLTIVPNPVINTMTVTFSTESEVAIIVIRNIQGQNVKTIAKNTVKGANNIAINTSDLSAGVYILTISSDSNFSTQRFVVNK